MKQTKAKTGRQTYIISIFLFLLTICSVFSFSRDVQAATKIAMNKKTAVMMVGESITLKAKGAGKKKVTWSTNKKAVATVSKGLVKAKKAGTATIKARVGGKKVSCKITVMSLNTAARTLYKDEQNQLKLTGGKNTVWYSENTEVAEVDNKGLVTAVDCGQTNIICQSNGRKLVIPVYVPCLNYNYKEITGMDRSVQFSLDYAGGLVSWRSSDPDIASVDKTGLVTSKKPGSSLITASYDNRDFNCLVFVYDDVIETLEEKQDTYVNTPGGVPGLEATPVIKEQFTDILYLDASVIPASTNVDRLTIDIAYYSSKSGKQSDQVPVRTYTVYKQNASINKCTSNSLTSYMPDHGCAASSLTTILTAYGIADPAEGPAATIKKNGYEYQALGDSAWTANYTKSNANRMPISMLGIHNVLSYYGISSEYVQFFDDFEAIEQIRNHLLGGHPVVFEVCTKKRILGTQIGSTDKKWSNSSHTMVMLGITVIDGQEYVVVADSADRTDADHGPGHKRIKYATLEELVSYMFSNTETASSNYYKARTNSGGYVLVD